MNSQQIAALAQATGLTYGELKEHLDKINATAEANSEPLPGPLADAFPARRVTIAGVAIRPFVAYDRVLIRALDSPLHRQLMELGKPVAERQATEFNDQDSYELIWLFTHPCEDVAKELGMDIFDPLGAEGVTPANKKKFRRKCVQEIGLKMDATVCSLIVMGISEQVARSIATALQYGAGESGEEGKVFTPPPREQTTASPGGSATAAGSSATIRK